MAQPNYGFAKRQRELAKKQKKEEKRLRKQADQSPQTEAGAPVPAPGPLGEKPQS